MLMVALIRWPSIDLRKQAYTPEGRALVDSLEAGPLRSRR